MPVFFRVPKKLIKEVLSIEDNGDQGDGDMVRANLICIFLYHVDFFNLLNALTIKK